MGPTRCILIILMLGFLSLNGQNPFTLEGQVWLIQEDNNALLEMTVGSNGGMVMSPVSNGLNQEIHALGFRSTDRMLYGLDPITHELFRIDKNGNLETLASPNLDANLFYLAGDVTPDGSRFVVIGSENGVDVSLESINLTTGNFEVTKIEFDHDTYTRDICFDPFSTKMYGYDAQGRRFYVQELGSPNVEFFSSIFIEHEVSGFYFDAFGNLNAIGSALFGTISALFDVDQTTGKTELISTTGIFPISDVASCPYSLELNNKIIPEVFFPCTDLSFEYTFSNQTGQTMFDVTLEHELPEGFSFSEINSIPFGGIQDLSTSDNLLVINNLNVPIGIHSWSVNSYVDDISKDIYKSQASLKNIPDQYGNLVLSNNPNSYATEDSTIMEVNVIEEDSLQFSNFICQGNTLTLDASDYGSNISWSNGMTSQEIDVTETNTFTLIAESGCKELFVSYDVVSASCPYTIELGHTVEPDSLFECSEVIFRYILENESGEDRYNVVLADTLPQGITFLEIINNPYESDLNINLLPEIFELDINVFYTGVDTVDILVNVDDVAVGNATNKAILKGIPHLLGPIRTSDDPSTTSIYLDSTSYTIKGVDNNSMQIDTFLCQGSFLNLDVSEFGETILWENGSTETTFQTSNIGNFTAYILDGCDTSEIMFYVDEAAVVSINFTQTNFDIHLGESISLMPEIINSGDVLSILWDDPTPTSLSCLNCLEPIATPLSNTTYHVLAQNEQCIDSTQIEIRVNENRRIYIPDIFTPNGDGDNDNFYFQSPDFANVILFNVYDRWGNLIYESNNFQVNNPNLGWNGFSNGKLIPSGVYVWIAEIEFFDGKIENWSGDITVHH